MGAATCSKCGELRARPGDTVCRVCYLVNALAEEHIAGEHTTVNASCIDCTRDPEYRAMLAREAATVKNAEKRERRADLLSGRVKPQNKTERKLVKSKPTPHFSHANCDHDATPPARTKCRKARKRAGLM